MDEKQCVYSKVGSMKLMEEWTMTITRDLYLGICTSLASVAKLTRVETYCEGSGGGGCLYGEELGSPALHVYESSFDKSLRTAT